MGEPCHDTLQCNSILFHVYCNHTSQRCECQQVYPVNIDNRICVRGISLFFFICLFSYPFLLRSKYSSLISNDTCISFLFSLLCSALSLGDDCEYHESCKAADKNSVCHQEESKCRCQENYVPRVIAGIDKRLQCELGKKTLHYMSNTFSFERHSSPQIRRSSS